MFFWPGKKVIVSITDGTAITAVTRLCVGSLRLGAVEYPNPNGGTIQAQGCVIIPIHAVLSVQVVS